MGFRAGKLSARKAWFFTDSGVVCLGAGITSESEHPVFTTINQCRLRGDVMVSAGGREFPAAPGRAALKRVEWVLHDGIGYCFLHPRKVLLEHGPRRGSWRNINRRYPDEGTTMDLFTLWMDHGARPRDASYAYAVAPGVHLDSLKVHTRELTGTVLANNQSLQAVRSAVYAGFAFHEAGTAAVGEAYTIGVSHPCLVLVKETEGSLQIAAANPKNQPLDLQIDINLQLQGESARWLPGRGITRIRFSLLPGGSEGGRSVVKRFISRRPESSPSSGRPASGRKASR
jgi:chondroitin AC lyase